jgi:O-antigen/teichoic acid export membrane protein
LPHVDPEVRDASPAEPPLSHRALKGFLITLSGTGMQGIAQILIVGILGRLLTPEDFGVVGAGMAFVGFSTILSQMGVGPALVQREELRDEHIATGFNLSVTMGLAFMAALWFAAPGLERFLRLDGFVPVLRGLSLVFVIRSLSLTSQALLQRELRFDVLAASQLVSYLAGFLGVGVTLAMRGAGVWALVWATLVQAATQTVILLVVRRHPVRPGMNGAAARDLLNFGVGMSLGKVLNYLATQADNFVVARLLGAGALGVYGRAYQLVVAPATLFGGVANKVLFPALAQVQNEPRRLARGYLTGVSLVATLTMPLSALIWMFAPEIIGAWLGPQWVEAVAPLRVLAVGILFRTSYKLSDSLVRATGAVYRRAWRQAVYAGLVIGGAIVGARWGVPGVAAGVLLAVAVNFGFMAELALKEASASRLAFLSLHLPGALLALAALGTARGVTLVIGPSIGNAYALALVASLFATGVCLALVAWSPARFAGPGPVLVAETLRGLIRGRGRGDGAASR